MAVFVVSKNGEQLMPTTRYGRVRHLLKAGKAIIYKHNPFTIQLVYETMSHTQPIEICVDAGYQHIGISIKSESKEYVGAQYDLLSDEKQRHDDCRRYRRTRRNRRRYRKPRFNNRMASKKPGWLAPSLKNKADRHIDLIKRYVLAMPVTDIVIELGQFDIQVLKAVSEGRDIPTGLDYQHGPRYGINTLREAVFQRDNHTCVFCGRSINDGAIFHVHHAYYWRGQHGDSLSELVTCCEKCHTSKNHQKGGMLYGFDKKLKPFNGAAFMNSVKWYIYNEVKDAFQSIRCHITYGAATKESRTQLGIEKSHINDAYAMGQFHPQVRTEPEYFQKRRRNNRILEKFYDAKYIDTRDGKKKSGKDLGCERTNRREPRMSDKSLRIYRGQKVSKGKRSIRKQHYPIQPGDIVLWGGKKIVAKGCHCKGANVMLASGKSVSVKKVALYHHVGAWQSIMSNK